MQHIGGGAGERFEPGRREGAPPWQVFPPPPGGRRIPALVLGATGTVGQRFVRRLAAHPWFQLEGLAASERSAGQSYGEACTWRLDGPAHGGLGHVPLERADPDRLFAPLVFSALDAGPAREIEAAYAKQGAAVFSNASTYRMERDVPLLVPEVNGDHLALVPHQREQRGWSGFIATNPNCTTAILAMALAPLHRAFGVETVAMTSMQAISGAGYPGVPSLDILGNLVPHIPGEEEKVEQELKKLFGTLRAMSIQGAAIETSAACHRVPVLEGHTLAVSVRLAGNPSLAAVAEALECFAGPSSPIPLPSAPRQPIQLHRAPDRPQPRLDVEWDRGMAVHVGRLRPCNLLGTKFTALGHNTERGAAGGSVLNAEWALASGAWRP